MNLIEEDAPGHENHVHTWWDFAFDGELLEKHLTKLQQSDGSWIHPSMSGPALVELFLSQVRRQREQGAHGNAELLLARAERVARALRWSLDDVEKALSSEPELARLLLARLEVNPPSLLARFELRRFASLQQPQQQQEDVSRVLAWVAELENVPEARDERCKALFVAGMIEQAHKISEPSSDWWQLTNGNIFERKPPPLSSRRPHKRVAASEVVGEQAIVILDEMELEKKVHDALKRGELEEAKELSELLYQNLKAAEAKRASVKYK